MKQTAVEWLKDQLEFFGNKHELQVSWITVDELFKQAKEMEKEQIIKAIDYCRDKYIDSENYYNETYGGNK